MNILHVGADGSPESVNGVSYKIWQIAAQQSKLGHNVTLVLFGNPSPEGMSFAESAHMRLTVLSRSETLFSPDDVVQPSTTVTPMIANFHSLWVLQHVLLARQLERRHIPYVVTPSGGLAAPVMNRGRGKKSIFSALFQKHYIDRAAAIVVTLPAEEEDLRAYRSHYSGRIKWIPNAIDASLLGDRPWSPENERPRLVYLGRFDVHHKGLDILCEIAERTPGVDYFLYGRPTPKELEGLRRMMRSLPPNVTIRDPVYNVQKASVLAGAHAYIQTSRWESFGNSIAEAMYLGVPCFIRETMSMAAILRNHNLGCVLSSDPKTAAMQVQSALLDTRQLAEWSTNARDYARTHFHPQVVADQYLGLYSEVLFDSEAVVP